MRQKLNKEQALKLRAQMKHKKPKFQRWESWRYKRVSESWRKPDGIDSKARRRAKGWPQLVEVGYRGPRKARGLHPSGYQEVIVRNVDDLAAVNPETQAIRIAHTVGMKKRGEISLQAGERHIYIVNPLPEVKPAEEEEAEGKEAEEAGETEAAEEETEEAKPDEKAEGETEENKPSEEEKS